MANSLEEVRKFFEGDRYATEATGIVIEKAEKGHSIVTLEPDGRHLNAVGGLMGAVYYTMADFAFAAASNNLHKVTVAMQVSINYLSAPKGEKLIATAKCIKDGKTSMVVNVDIVDDTGRDVAQFVGTGFKL